MRKVIFTFFVCVLSIGLAQAELGKGYVDTEPSDQPIMATDNNFAKTRFWNCKEHVNPTFQKTVLSDLQIMSEDSKLQKPENYCVYKILDLKSQNKTVYSIDFFINQASMDRCLKKDNCDEVRSVSLPFIKGEIYRSYFLRSANKNIVSKICLTSKGDLVSANKSCD